MYLISVRLPLAQSTMPRNLIKKKVGGVGWFPNPFAAGLGTLSRWSGLDGLDIPRLQQLLEHLLASPIRLIDTSGIRNAQSDSSDQHCLVRAHVSSIASSKRGGQIPIQLPHRTFLLDLT